MYSLREQKHTGQGEWLLAALVGASILAIIGASSFAIEPACAQSAQSGQSAQSAHDKTTKSTKARKSSPRRRISKRSAAAAASADMSNHVDPVSLVNPELRALTPHADLTPGQKADAEVTSVLRYGARKHAEGNFEEAEAAFRHVLSRDPSNVDAFYDLGALAERKGDLIAALSSYRAALALKPHDKEIAEAVSSIEKTLRNRPAFSFRENHGQAVRGSSSPVSGSSFVPNAAPSLSPRFAPALIPGASSAAYDGAPVLTSPVLSSPVLSGSAADLPPLVASPQLGPALLVDPATIAPGTFQLSSAKNGLLAPTLGVTPASAALPATAPVVGVAPRSHPVARMFLNTALNQGASIGLRAAGLHCPACHFMRFRF
ncbi:MAG: tetratricopeptide repeat protein [Candidatus Obscuribacterales bacterium]